jgi:hypothetical protein
VTSNQRERKQKGGGREGREPTKTGDRPSNKSIHKVFEGSGLVDQSSATSQVLNNNWPLSAEEVVIPVTDGPIFRVAQWR